MGSRLLKQSMYVLLALCLCVAIPCVAQKTTATLNGVVTDPGGAVVGGANVAATNTATGEVRTATTNTSGAYVLTDMAPGVYDLSIKTSSFKEFVSKGVQLNVSTNTTVNAQLAVGSATEQVTVEANAVQVETSTGTVGNLVEGNQVRELPLNGRSFAQLTQLMPGVSPASNFDSKHKGLEAGVDFSVNGNNTTGNLFLVDGVNNNDIGSQRTILVYPSIDAIQEFKILRNSYGPEYGQAMGAIVNIVTKSGTNGFHGGVYYFGRNDKLNATDYFNNLNGAPKDVLKRNDFGYNLGGPVVKDKLFFFWSQEWNREIRGKLRSANVPTVAEKSGDFSAQAAAVPFRSLGCDANPTLGPTVPSISPTGSLLVQLFPDPNIAPANEKNCINWAQSFSSPIYWREDNIRMDYQLGRTWSVMGRFTDDQWNQPSPSTLGYWGDDRYPSVDPNWKQPGYQATIKVTKLLGSTAVNDFQVSYAANRITVTAGGQNPGLVQQINASYQTYFPTSDKLLGSQVGYPVFWGGAGDGNVGSSDTLWNMGPWHNNEELYILKDDFSKVHGSHSFKLGFLASNNRKNEVSGGSSGEAPNYWGVSSNDSGNGVFNMLNANTTWGFGESQTNPFAETRWHDYEFYFGDSWKLTRNLTVEYGARWSFLRNPFSRVDKIASWQPELYDPSLGAVACNGLQLVPGTDPCTALGFGGTGGVAGPNRSLKDNNNHEIAPRLGFAWDPKGDGKTSIRGGVGQFWQRDRISNYLYIATNSPFSVSAGGTRPLTGSVPAGSLTSTASPSWGIDPSDREPYTWQFNFTVEREVYRGSKLELAYVGNIGRNILQYKDVNAVLPGNRVDFALNNTNNDRFATGPVCTAASNCFGEIKYGEWTAHSNYNALQALYRARVKKLDAQFAYTWSKSLANTDITNSGNTSNTATVTDVADPNRDYGPTPINRKHVFTSNIVYTFPALTGSSALLRSVLGGWEAGGILSYASGPSQTIFGLNGGATNAAGGIQGTGDNENQKPNLLLSDCRAHGGPKYQWYNPAAFTLDHYVVGSFGNENVGSCTGPGIANTDFSAYKNFKISERVNVQFRMEFFNLFNKTQFRADQINLQLASGAVVCTAAAPCAGYADNTVQWNFNTPGQGQGNFGQAGSNGTPGDRGPREIQYALKITF
jgi:Carboxypeptidase regulatory-like domain/TonB-dependent Receptor Plug Domain